MPKWRKLHVKIIESQEFNDMPDDFTRLVWLLLPLAMDKEGRSIDNAALVKSRTMPMREDVSTSDVRRALDWFNQHGMIIRYEVDGHRYFYIPTWHTYQNTAREAESEYPAPPEQTDEATNRTIEEEENAPEEAQESVTSKSRVTHELVASNSGVTHESGTQKSSLDIDIDIEQEDLGAAVGGTKGDAPPKKPPGKRKKAKSRADPRTSSREIKLYRRITGRWPPKPRYDDVITALAGADEAQAVMAYEAWKSRGYNPANPDWVEWAATGPPKERAVKRRVGESIFAGIETRGDYGDNGDFETG